MSVKLEHWRQIYGKTSKQIVVTCLLMFMKIDHLTHLRPHVAFLEYTPCRQFFLSGTRARQRSRQHGKNLLSLFLRSRTFFVCVWNLLACCTSDLSKNNCCNYASIKKSTPKILQGYQISCDDFARHKINKAQVLVSRCVDLLLYIINDDVRYHLLCSFLIWAFKNDELKIK